MFSQKSSAKIRKIINTPIMRILKKCFFSVTKRLSLQCDGHQAYDNIIA